MLHHLFKKQTMQMLEQNNNDKAPVENQLLKEVHAENTKKYVSFDMPPVAQDMMTNLK